MDKVKGLVAGCLSFCLFFIFLYIHTFIQSQFIHPSPFAEASLHFLIAYMLSGEDLPVVPRIELGPALQKADALPTEPRRTTTEPRRTIWIKLFREQLIILTINVPVVYMDSPPSKQLCTAPYKQQVHWLFYVPAMDI